jgi:hypothetical protein
LEVLLTQLLTKQEMIEAAYQLTGGNISDLSTEQMYRLMTVSQYVTDLCLNEIERRGELTFRDSVVIVPYHSAYSVETILTRQG